MDEWISVKDRLPEYNTLVILYAKNPYGQNDFFIGYRGRAESPNGSFSENEWVAKLPMSSSGYVIDERGNQFLKPRKVTHWAPLVEPLVE